MAQIVGRAVIRGITLAPLAASRFSYRLQMAVN
jgi:hypothetical protein